MLKTWIVLKNELYTVVARRSFLLTLVLIPLIGFLVTMVVSWLQPQDSGGINPLLSFISNPATVGIEGYVDAGGIIAVLPKDLQPRLKPFAGEAQAKAAYQAGEISGYYLVSADYLATGEVVYARADYNPMTGLSQANAIKRAIEYNLVGQDQRLFARLQRPVNLEVVSTGNEPNRDSGNMLTFFMPYTICLFFYIMIFGTASLMLNSVTGEKQNRVLEILMTSVTPTELLAGKIVALGLTGLLQTVVWSSTGVALMQISGKSLGFSAAFQLPPSIIAWGALFFLLGYALYGSLMAGLGALVPNLKEASQATTVMIIPMMIPLVFVSALIGEPNGTIAIVLSLFPLSAPVAMMTRLAAGNVPVWQIITSAVLMVGMTFFVIRAVAGMFRAQNLLSGQGFSLKRFFRALAGKV